MIPLGKFIRHICFKTYNCVASCTSFSPIFVLNSNSVIEYKPPRRIVSVASFETKSSCLFLSAVLKAVVVLRCFT